MKKHLSQFRDKSFITNTFVKCLHCDSEFLNLPVYKTKSGCICEVCLEGAGELFVGTLFGEKK
jgi:hypothetical protein